MKVVIQRASEACVLVDKKIVGKINYGLCIFVGFKIGDNEKDLHKMVKKIVNLRIFDDENGIMNKSILNVNGEILSISQFTLYANTKSGNRPSYANSLNREQAIVLYNKFNSLIKEYNINVETGIFGAEMEVKLTNDGPVTIIIDMEE